MFVLDSLRRLSSRKLTIPPFHLGHLGFRPGLEVDSQYVDFDNAQGHELTLTPFQGRRDNLFILKCIFTEQPGVVASALSAFARMRLNVLSLESATIDRDTKHVLFCILSWAPSRYTRAVELDESAKHKLIDVLPLLPTLDKRYLYFLETFFLFCFDALAYEKVPGKNLLLPRIDIKLFDDFYVEQPFRPLKISREPLKVEVDPADADVKVTLPSVVVELSQETAENSPALLFSETETKALHIIFPKPGREKRFLHIGFTHQNRPGALLLIATLLQYCGFSIKTSLLRQYDIQRNINVWETMLEYVGEIPINPIPDDKAGVEWFRNWCFGDENPKHDLTKNLINYLRSYSVEVCRPSYPRRARDALLEFEPLNLSANVVPDREFSIERDEVFEIRHHKYRERLALLERASQDTGEYSWLARLMYPALQRIKLGGQVFMSIPRHCAEQIHLIKTNLQTELDLDVITYQDGDAAERVSAAALEKIRAADFFLGVWHPERDKPRELSPWMPFEFGVALALGKPYVLIAHRDIPGDVKSRIMRDYSLIDYSDVELKQIITEKLVPACRARFPRPLV